MQDRKLRACTEVQRGYKLMTSSNSTHRRTEMKAANQEYRMLVSHFHKLSDEHVELDRETQALFRVAKICSSLEYLCPYTSL